MSREIPNDDAAHHHTDDRGQLSRRTVLGILGLGALTAGGAVVTGLYPDAIDEADVYPGPTDDDEDSSPGRIGVVDHTPSPSDVPPEKKQIGEPAQSFRFDYSPIDQTVNDSPNIKAIRARPTKDNQGDRIQFIPRPEVTLEKIEMRIRLGLSIGDHTSVRSTIDESDVTFTGGSVGTQAALIGTYEDATRRVLITRGRTVSVAKQLALNWTL